MRTLKSERGNSDAGGPHDSIEIRCNDSAETWYLTCTSNHWKGQTANCTTRGESQSANRVMLRHVTSQTTIQQPHITPDPPLPPPKHSRLPGYDNLNIKTCKVGIIECNNLFFTFSVLVTFLRFNVFFIFPTFLKKIKTIHKYRTNVNKFQQNHLKAIAINTSACFADIYRDYFIFLNKLTLLMMTAVI